MQIKLKKKIIIKKNKDSYLNKYYSIYLLIFVKYPYFIN